MCQYIIVDGGFPLTGEVDVPSAKNSILPLIAATLLCEDTVRFLKVPMLSDVMISTSILNNFGFIAKRTGQEIVIVPKQVTNFEIPTFFSEQMRASVLFLSPMLSRFKKVKTGMPGGCKIGVRPIDIHLDGLVKMGAKIEWEENTLSLSAENGLRGVDYSLRYPSVGATETLLMAAVCAKGESVFTNVACEPEIIDLVNFLRLCGAKITGEGSSVIKVIGVEHLKGATYTALPDRIFASTIACAVAVAKGDVVIKNCEPKTYFKLLNILKTAGCEVEQMQANVRVVCKNQLKGVGRITAGVYPAFPTDSAPLLAAALICASSESCINDTVFENRFECSRSFNAMGAKTCLQDRTLKICPCEQLHSARVFATDLRGGAALVIAALGARGKTEIGNLHYINRGYENLTQTFCSLGGNIVEKR